MLQTSSYHVKIRFPPTWYESEEVVLANELPEAHGCRISDADAFAGLQV